jgi:hypothetical protein
MGAHIMKIVYQQRRGSEKPHNLYDGDHEINDVCMPAIQQGRPRKKVDYGLLLALRIDENLGWSRVAMEYTRRTGEYISKQTCKRRYYEEKSRDDQV